MNYENKIYSFPDYAGKNVLIKIDEIENQILCFPEGNLEDKPLVRPINESEIVQFYKKFGKSNRLLTYKTKRYSGLKDFPSRKAAVTINKSENRMYIHPDQDLNKVPVILDILTGKRIQFYQKLHNKGNFKQNGIIFYFDDEHKNKLAIVRIDDEKNEISVFPDGNLNEKPVVFNKTTGKKIVW